MRILSPLAGVLALAATAVAQTAVLPTQFTAAEAGTTGNVWRAGTNRVQSFYDSTNFGPLGSGVPITISNIEFRLAGAAATAIVTYPNVEIYLQYSATNYAAPSTTFANNRTVAFPTTPNFAGPVTTLPVSGTTPNDWFINIPLTTPFTYDPALGQDLLMELVILANPAPLTGNTISAGFNVPVHLCNSVRSVGSTVAAAGTLSAFAPVVRFGVATSPTAGFNTSNGAGCYNIARSFYELFAGSANDLSNTTVTMTMNANGGYDVATTTGATIVTPTGVGLGLIDDIVSPAQTLPFTFQYPGGSTSSVFVDSNGSINLNGAGVSQIGGAAPALLTSTVHRLAASMQDLLPDGATNVANVYVDTTSTPGQALFTWLNVPCFNTPVTALTSTFQVALIDNGTSDTVEFRFVTLANDSSSNAGAAITGFSLGGNAIDGGSVDLTAGPVSTIVDTPALSLHGTNRPITGATWGLQVNNIPVTGVLGVDIFGVTDPGLNDLTFLGLPGCGLRSSLDLLNAYLPSGSTHAYSVALPADPALVGLSLYTTSAMFTQPPANAFGAITANGVQGTIGDN